MAENARKKFVMVLREVREFLDMKPLQYAYVFAIVANRPGITFQDATELTGLAKSTTARIISWFVSEGLMESYEIPGDRRSKAARLSQRGEVVIAAILYRLGQ